MSEKTCKHTDCEYYCENEPRYCSYYATTGIVRKAPIYKCTLYTKKEVREDLSKMDINSQTTTPTAVEEKQKTKEMYSNILRRLDSGESIEKLAEEYGVTEGRIKQSIARRERAKKGDSEERAKSPAPPPEAEQRDSRKPVALPKASLSSEDIVERAYVRMTDMLDSVTRRDSLRMRIAALVIMSEITEDALKQLDVMVKTDVTVEPA